MAKSPEFIQDDYFHHPRKKSGSFTLQDFLPASKKAQSLNRGMGRINRSMSRSQSTADLECVMHNAVLRDDPETLERVLIDDKLDVDNYTPAGITALHQACILGSITCVKMLVKAGADIYVKSVNSVPSTALKLAAANGHFEVAEYLISMGAQDEDIKHGHQKKK